MSQTKHRRPAKRQLGQFMTPAILSRSILDRVTFSASTRLLEPCFGDGSFIIPLIERFLEFYQGPIEMRLEKILTRNIYGVEIDPVLYQACLDKIEQKWGHLPNCHNLVCGDFFRFSFQRTPGDETAWHDPFTLPQIFDLVIGNPPFGGTIALDIQDGLDRRYGFRNGEKIKKETYAFFIVKCLEHLEFGGRLVFICSNSFLTIRAMRGLRRALITGGSVSVESLETFSKETSYPMVLLDMTRSGQSDFVTVSGQRVPRKTMELTGNFSWSIDENDAKYFRGPNLGQYVICSSGMTIGRNEWFLKEICGSEIIEPYEYEFYDEPVTVQGEIQRARLHTLSPRSLEIARRQEQSGVKRRCVRVTKKAVLAKIPLPHPDYRYYNKSSGAIIYSKPTHVIYWKDDGDAVITFKKCGNWYLHGVGGRPYFGRSGLTWQLVATRLNVRYLPEGYILDSGAPCAFLRPGVADSELYFILGWACTNTCTRLLKSVINHTQNIRSKDFERLPYPFWVSQIDKDRATAVVRALIADAMAGREVSRGDPRPEELETLYSFPIDHPFSEGNGEHSSTYHLALW